MLGTEKRNNVKDVSKLTWFEFAAIFALSWQLWKKNSWNLRLVKMERYTIRVFNNINFGTSFRIEYKILFKVNLRMWYQQFFKHLEFKFKDNYLIYFKNLLKSPNKKGFIISRNSIQM